MADHHAIRVFQRILIAPRGTPDTGCFYVVAKGREYQESPLADGLLLGGLAVVLPEAVEDGDGIGGGDRVADLLAMALALDDAGAPHLIEML